jgi:protein CpxP
MKKLMATVGVLALLVGNSFAQDQSVKVDGHPHKMDEEKGKRHGMMADIPNLTDAQKANIKSIKEASKKQGEPQRKQMKEIRMKLNELKTDENPDSKQINELIDKSAKLKAEMEKSRTASELKVRSILTPEQRKAVDAKRKENIEMREKKHMERKQMKDAK